MTLKIKFNKLTSDAMVPIQASSGSAGYDLFANADCVMSPYSRGVVSTGICLEIPHGYEGQIRPRSGLAFKNGLTVLNSPGTVDSDYRGEIKIILFNSGENDFVVTKNMRIAQIVICPVLEVVFEEGLLSDTSRGEGGFGSTGL